MGVTLKVMSNLKCAASCRGFSTEHTDDEVNETHWSLLIDCDRNGDTFWEGLWSCEMCIFFTHCAAFLYKCFDGCEANSFFRWSPGTRKEGSGGRFWTKYSHMCHSVSWLQASVSVLQVRSRVTCVCIWKYKYVREECVFAHEKIRACKSMCQYVNTTKSFRCRPGLQPPQIPTWSSIRQTSLTESDPWRPNCVSDLAVAHQGLDTGPLGLSCGFWH